MLDCDQKSLKNFTARRGEQTLDVAARNTKRIGESTKRKSKEREKEIEVSGEAEVGSQSVSPQRETDKINRRRG